MGLREYQFYASWAATPHQAGARHHCEQQALICLATSEPMASRSASGWTVWYNWRRCHTYDPLDTGAGGGLTDTWYDAEWLAGVVEAHLPKPCEAEAAIPYRIRSSTPPTTSSSRRCETSTTMSSGSSSTRRHMSGVRWCLVCQESTPVGRRGCEGSCHRDAASFSGVVVTAKHYSGADASDLVEKLSSWEDDERSRLATTWRRSRSGIFRRGPAVTCVERRCYPARRRTRHPRAQGQAGAGRHSRVDPAAGSRLVAVGRSSYRQRSPRFGHLRP